MPSRASLLRPRLQLPPLPGYAASRLKWAYNSSEVNYPRMFLGEVVAQHRTDLAEPEQETLVELLLDVIARYQPKTRKQLPKEKVMAAGADDSSLWLP